ncbi:MAG: cobamide remodeling phosphodiesterase CbiR [Chloroflexi bacterium]|nr:cobamide remodeling phosphodiesterase CbiR [Chloroflexota bacterium]
MRFGIKEMQFNTFFPPGLSRQTALAHLAGFDHAAHVRRLAEQGFQLIELGGDLALFFPQAFTGPAIARLAELKAELGLSYTVHLPLWSVEPSTSLRPVREGSVRVVTEIIRATRPLEPEAYVLHATGPLAAEFYRRAMTDSTRDLILRDFFQNSARESIRAILAETGLSSRRLAIETIEFPFHLLLETAVELDVAICLDTGHVLAGFSGPIDLFQALELCLPRLAEIHLHDAPWQGAEMKLGYGRDHQALGKGDLDVTRLLDRLTAASYQGPIIFELSVEGAHASLNLLRSLRPEAVAPADIKTRRSIP